MWLLISDAAVVGRLLTGPSSVWAAEKVQTYTDYLGFHLSDSGEHIWVKWIRYREFSHGFIDDFC